MVLVNARAITRCRGSSCGDNSYAARIVFCRTIFMRLLRELKEYQCSTEPRPAANAEPLNQVAATSAREGRAFKKLVICLDNSGYEVSLERRKIYVSIPDAQAQRLGQIRIIDESGEDYLYPEKNSGRSSAVSSAGSTPSDLIGSCIRQRTLECLHQAVELIALLRADGAHRNANASELEPQHPHP